MGRSCGARIAARAPERRTDEIRILIALANRFNAPGPAEVTRMA